MTHARTVAFLRAINVGGHIVKMDRLRELFTALRLRNVETVIASGNVLFDATASDGEALERRVERHLHQALGYEVATFVRSADDMRGVVSYESPIAQPEGAATLMVGFLHAAPTPEARARALDLATPDDELEIVGREVYWTRLGRISDSKLGGGLLEKTLGVPMTMRNITTVRKIAVKCGWIAL